MIRMEQIAFHYPKREALFENLSLHIEKGQWVSIVGPNGAGKSTLAKLINGLLSPAAGQIQVDGLPVTREHVDEVRKKVGYLFQNPDNQFIATTVRDDIAFGLENRAIPREEMLDRIQEVAVELQIEDWLDRHPASLSGGQKQRVAIAGLLVLQPDIMIWDEATSMLDERSKQAMMEQLKELHQNRNMTILSVTHDAEEILASERAIVIKNGQVAADMTPLELFEQEELAYECKLMPPFALALSMAMKKKGCRIAPVQDERELVNAIWPS